MIIGASFYDLLKGYRPSPGFRVELGAVITRAIIVPAIFLLYANYGWIPQQTSWMSEVLLVQAAMPAGVFALVVVKNYEQDTETGLSGNHGHYVGKYSYPPDLALDWDVFTKS